ncbi:hypothetical protein BKA69DRAFT_609949 [Paraphysoderma sedebokerense]|nr:hypothetical protein BKA69DRAFT_609949 [Paraphysoderma sedebokerense]
MSCSTCPSSSQQFSYTNGSNDSQIRFLPRYTLMGYYLSSFGSRTPTPEETFTLAHLLSCPSTSLFNPNEFTPSQLSDQFVQTPIHSTLTICTKMYQHFKSETKFMSFARLCWDTGVIGEIIPWLWQSKWVAEVPENMWIVLCRMYSENVKSELREWVAGAVKLRQICQWGKIIDNEVMIGNVDGMVEIVAHLNEMIEFHKCFNGNVRIPRLQIGECNE